MFRSKQKQIDRLSAELEYRSERWREDVSRLSQQLHVLTHHLGVQIVHDAPTPRYVVLPK